MNDVKKCDVIEDFDERLRCKAKVLNEITKEQDIVNLNIMKDFSETNPNCSEDPRWIPVHMVDNANAIILGISQHDFNPKTFSSAGYVDEKLNSLNSKSWRLKRGDDDVE